MKESDVKYETTITEAVEEINKKKETGEVIHPLTEEGLKALDVANMIVGTIMRRNQPDLGFFKVYMNSTNSRINLMGPKEKAPQKQGSKTLRRKRSNRVNDSNE